jgi:hypothetical protein
VAPRGKGCLGRDSPAAGQGTTASDCRRTLNSAEADASGDGNGATRPSRSGTALADEANAVPRGRILRSACRTTADADRSCVRAVASRQASNSDGSETVIRVFILLHIISEHCRCKNFILRASPFHRDLT